MNGDDYDAPAVLIKIASLLQFLRKEYERSFADAIVLQTSEASYNSYRDGLIFLGCFIAGIGFIWGCILLILKINGPSLGCAAGYAVGMFRAPKRREDQKFDASSNDVGDGLFFNNNNNDFPSTTTTTIQQVTDYDVTNISICESTLASNDGRPASLEQPTQENVLPSNKKGKNSDDHPWATEKVVQLSFLFLCCGVLLCSILVFSYTLRPLVEAIDHSKDIELDTKDIVNDTIVTLLVLSSASNESQRIINTVTLDHNLLCPNYTAIEIEQTLGVDLQSILDLLDDNYTGLTSQLSGNLSEINHLLLQAEEIMEDVSRAYQISRRYLWIIPTIVFPLCFAVSIAMNGTYQAMRRESTQDFQLFLSKWILPILIIFSVLCFGVAIVFAIATAIGSDACLAGSTSGSPYDTVEDILNVTSSTNSSSEIWHDFALDYAMGCSGSTSIGYITNLHREIQRMVNFIWKSLSQVDSVGQGNLVEYCGADERLVELLDGSRDLAKLLYSAQVSVKRMNESLSCENIYPIYDTAVNDLMCSETVSATAWGFILFLCMGIATMGIISLRAAWSYKAAEEKIFDESELAENIILDEHEEYLHYISAYKHEWEEYRGVNVAVADPSQILQPNQDAGLTDSSSSTEADESLRLPPNVGITYSEASSVTDSDMVSESTSIEVVDGPDQAFNPYISADSQTVSTSTSVDNISFLSLNDAKKVEKETVSKRPMTLKLPPSLLQERDDHEGDDCDDHTFIDGYEDSRDDDERDQHDVVHGNVIQPKSQVQIMRSKYKMIPSTATKQRSNLEPTDINMSPKVYHKPSISKILDELEELSTSRLGTPSPHRTNTNNF